MFKTGRKLSFREADTVLTFRVEVDHSMLGKCCEFQSLSLLFLLLTIHHENENISINTALSLSRYMV